MTPPSHRLVAHTADLGIEFSGSDWPELYLAAARGLLEAYGLQPPRAVEERAIDLSADSPEELIVAWLSELIFLVATERWIPGEIDVRKAGERSLSARLRGESFSEKRVPIAREIKAATYHGLTVSRGEGLSATVILDV